jgi:pilus assembly protein CpaF
LAQSYVIAVVGGKGGVGKSTFAANYAIATHIDSKGKVLLVDLDPRACGDISMILGVKPKRTLLELGQHEGRLDANGVTNYCAPHPSGIHFMPSVLDVEQNTSLTAEGTGKALTHLMNVYNFIIVDLGSDLDESGVKVLEQSSLIFVLTMPELIVLHHTRRIIEKVQNLLFPPEMIKIVLNRFTPKKGILPQVVQTNLKKPIVAVIPEDEVTTVTSMAKAQPFVIAAARTEITKSYYMLVRSVAEQQMLEKLSQIKKPNDALSRFTGNKGKVGGGQVAGPGGKDAGPTNVVFDRSQMKDEKPSDPWSALKQRIHRQLIETMDLKKVDTEVGNDPKKKAVLREKTKTVVVELLNKEDHPFRSRDEIQKLVKEILDEALELGPIQDLLQDDSVNEIMVNRKDQIYVERGGKLVKTSVGFSGTAQLLATIERIVAPIGRRIDEKTPYVDARLPDGSRVHAIIPPLSIQGPMLTIRKFSKNRLTYKDLVKYGSMTEEMADFLRSCIEARLNVIISGGTGSGKTTLLNVMASFIPATERILTVEDSAELQLPQDHWGRLETRPANIEGKGEVSIRELVRNTLRMRPDRIVVGECRAGEALDMLQAMNTGHDGSMTTVHSNSPRDCIARLETLVMMAGMDLPAKAIREQIASAVNLIVQQSRLSDGSRKVTSITEVVGMQGDVVTLQEIFGYKRSGMDKNRKVIGKFVATGFIPKFIDELEQQGIKIPRGIFSVT